MRNANATANGGDIHNVPARLFSHVRQHSQGEIDRSPEHYVHCVFEIRMIETVERSDFDEPCIVDEYVDSSEVLDDALDKERDL